MGLLPLLQPLGYAALSARHYCSSRRQRQPPRSLAPRTYLHPFPFPQPLSRTFHPLSPFFMKVAGPRARVPITSPLGRRGPGVASVPSIWSELLPTHAMWRAVPAELITG